MLYVVGFAGGLLYAWLVRALVNKLLKLERADMAQLVVPKKGTAL